MKKKSRFVGRSRSKRKGPRSHPAPVARERYEVVQFGEVVAIVDGPAKAARAEANRYLWQYAHDGPVELRSHGVLVERVAELPFGLPLP